MRQWIMMMFAFALGLSPLGSAAHGQAAADAEPLVGLWAYQQDFVPALRGPLVIRRSGGGWHRAAGRASRGSAGRSGRN